MNRVRYRPACQADRISTVNGTTPGGHMYNNSNNILKVSLRSIYIFFLLIVNLSSLNAQEYTCPKPYNSQFEANYTNRYCYVAPGQLVSVHIFVTANPCPCNNPGDIWNLGGYLERLEGYKWPPGVHPSGSDCFSEFFSFSAPFDIDEYENNKAHYVNRKAGSLIIYQIIPYQEPDPCKTDAMDPVNTFTGAFRFTDQDYSNSDIQFSRSYNASMLVGCYSADTLKRWKNPLGIGWQHNYNIYTEELELESDTGCIVWEGKTMNVYNRISAGVYHPMRQNHTNLKKIGNTWYLYKADGTIYYFGSSNKVDSIVDRNGRKTSFSYTGNYLSQVTGKDGHTLSFGYSADSFLTSVSITENGNTKQFEYRYHPITYIVGDEEDADTFDLMGAMQLVQVVQHYPTGSADSLLSLYKYYYNGNDLRMVAKIFPQDGYTSSDTIWSGNYKKGDRLYVWYDSLGQAIYEEVIDGDGDTLISNDKTVYKAYTGYYRYSLYQPGNDSALTYVYTGAAGADSAHSPYDTTFVPQAPASGYYIEKRDYHNDRVGRQIFMEKRGTAISRTKFFKDLDFNDTLVVTIDDDTTRYSYQSYTLNSETRSTQLPTKIVYPNGDSILNYYHAPDNNAPAFFLLDSIIDELGRKTQYFYDNNYNLDSLRYYNRYIAGVGTTTLTHDYTFNSHGNLTQLKDPRGNSTYYSYAPNDTGPYLTQTRIDMSPSGSGNEDIITKYKYNTDIGKVDTLIYFQDYPGDSSLVYYTHDVMSRLQGTHYPDGTRDSLTYDKRGNLIKKETYLSSTCHFRIEYVYDARDRLTLVKEYSDMSGVTPKIDTTRYAYDLNDALIGFINANDTTGISTEISYEYDAGKLIKVAYPDTTYDSLGYYTNNNLKFKKDRRGKVVAYLYDSRNRLIKERYFNSLTAYDAFPDSVPAESLVFTYDDVGNMVSMLDKNGTINYSYDEMNGLDTLNCYQDMLVIYKYDTAGNRKKLKVVKASDTTTVYLNQSYPTYDEANRLDKTAVGTDTFAFTYWDTGPIKKIDYPNNVKEQYKLTSRNFIDVITDSSGNNQLFKFDYKYNAKGDRDTLILYLPRLMQSPISGTITYMYDDLRRLTQAQYPRSIYNKTNSYTYDKVGNRLKKIAGTDTTNYTYNKRNNHMTYAGAAGYSYDNNGNLTQITPPEEIGYYFTWDFENRLVKIRKTGSGPGDSLRFTYCGLGKRIRKIHGASDTTKYCYDGMYAVCEFGGHLDLKAKYVYVNGMLLARYDNSPADTHYFHHDGLGSVIGMTNENGNVEQSYFYDDFGNSLGSWGSVSNSYLYTGQEYDDEISGAELYNLRARYYDPGIGRFVSEDPVNKASKGTIALNPHELNTYLYVLNNPINWVDPLGLKGIKKCTSKEVKKELKQIIEAFHRCCKRGFRPPCYEKSENIIECMYIIIGGKLDCCDYGIHFMPQFWFIFHYGIRADCYDCCGRHYQKYFEPFLCWAMPTQKVWW